MPEAKTDIRSILATDCGSTTTKAILIEKQDGEFRLSVRGEAPTTVEAPAEDVTLGVINAAQEVSELAGRPIVSHEGGEGHLIKPYDGKSGVDIYLSTSSAGGGLQMVVAGVVKQMTAESAQRAALGAGACVLETLSSNDRRLAHERIELIRKLRPDMVLLAGGVDGGTQKHVVELAQLFAAADPRPRLGASYQLPVIYAGNKDVREAVKEILGGKTALEIVDNIRPTLEEENLQPARLKIQNQFLEHVMAHAPGYPKLMAMADEPVMPTPAAVGLIMKRIADMHGINILGADIGGATTDVFSVFDGIFTRTVSANYGMSYSISNVFAEAGLENIMRWAPFDIPEKDLRNRVKNKMIRPTSIPYLLEELMIEQAVCREALRLSFESHRFLASGLKGVQKESDIGSMFSQETGGTLVDMMKLDMLIGSGGVLSHAPHRAQAAMMLIDAFQPLGVTRLAVDSIFMMPQLGVLSEILPEAAANVFEKDCLIELGTCCAPLGPAKPGQTVMRGRIGDDNFELHAGEMKLIKVAEGQSASAEFCPSRGLDMGAGPGHTLRTEVRGGVVGIILDGRGRPMELPQNKDERLERLRAWNETLDCYPEAAKL